MSGSELILYGYGIVCVCMLAFNIVYDILQNSRDVRLEERNQKFTARIREEMDGLKSGGRLDPDVLRRLRRRLSHVDNLVAFERALSSLEPDCPALVEYRRQIQPVFLELAEVYRRREDMQAAYFAYFLSQQKPRGSGEPDPIQDILLDFMGKDSLYCRINTLRALCAFGTPECLAEAVSIQDRTGAFFHEKILTDGLLAFTGDHQRLAALLWERLERFSPKTRLSVLNYIRFQTGDYAPGMLRIMTDPSQDKELRLSAIRYFGRYPREEAREPLLSFAANRDPIDWEYAAVSASCLAEYPGEDVKAVLMEAIHSANWYVRRNAAISLERLGLNYLDLAEIMGGRDRYAREMMAYRLDRRGEEALA